MYMHICIFSFQVRQMVADHGLALLASRLEQQPQPTVVPLSAALAIPFNVTPSQALRSFDEWVGSLW